MRQQALGLALAAAAAAGSAVLACRRHDAAGAHDAAAAAAAAAAADAPAAERFAAEARAATARYQSRDAAIADGYRRVGGDFPAMGEHWVSLPRVMADSFAPALPAILTYVQANGVPTLAGVAYTALLERGEQLPDFAPARSYWHEHNGSVVDESFLAEHDTHTGAHGGNGPDGEEAIRVGVLHAWVWLPNPDGVFATDNWTLPYRRLGLAPPPGPPPPDAARALALAAGGADFYADALRAALAPTAAEDTALTAVLARHRDQLTGRLAAPRPSADTLPPDLSPWLSARWSALWNDIERAVPGRGAEVRAVRRRM